MLLSGKDGRQEGIQPSMVKVRTIKDIAELAGVSTGTVSRALAGSELISKKTREKIQALADEHGFRPNIMARNLRIQRTGAIGVLIPLAVSFYERAQSMGELRPDVARRLRRARDRM